jgi:DNA-damage-inducible protein D
MNDLELIFSMLGEASTTAIVKTRNPKGFTENKIVAKQWGFSCRKSKARP